MATHTHTATNHTATINRTDKGGWRGKAGDGGSGKVRNKRETLSQFSQRKSGNETQRKAGCIRD